MYIDSYQNFRVTANAKSTINTHTNKKSNPNITLKILIRPQEKRTKEKKKKDKQNKFKTINKKGNKNIYINNYLKCNLTKYPNQKT